MILFYRHRKIGIDIDYIFEKKERKRDRERKNYELLFRVCSPYISEK